MASNTTTDKSPASPLSCIDCGAPVSQAVGGISICDNCLTTRGSCCPEFGAFDLTQGDAVPREYASAPCSAHLFEEADSVQHLCNEQYFHTPSGARLDYQIDGNKVMNISHTFVPKHLRGKGIAADLMEAAMRYAKKEQLRLEATCDYAIKYLQRK